MTPHRHPPPPLQHIDRRSDRTTPIPGEMPARGRHAASGVSAAGQRRRLLAGLAADLRRRFDADYRVVEETPADAALAALSLLADADEPVALVIVDEQLPGGRRPSGCADTVQRDGGDICSPARTCEPTPTRARGGRCGRAPLPLEASVPGGLRGRRRTARLGQAGRLGRGGGRHRHPVRPPVPGGRPTTGHTPLSRPFARIGPQYTQAPSWRTNRLRSCMSPGRPRSR
jgi:hypothetical protein